MILRQAVSHEIRIARERNATSRADETIRSIALVELVVLIQLLLRAERSIAFRAFEGFVLTVIGDVFIHGRGGGEAFAAEMTLIRLFAGMHQHVLLQFLPMEKSIAANFAIKIVVATFHGLHGLPILVGVSIAVVHGGHDFVGIINGHHVMTVAVVSIAPLHRLLLLLSPLFRQKVADRRVVAGPLVEGAAATEVRVIAAHGRQIAEGGFGQSAVFAMFALFDRVDDEVVGEVRSALAAVLTLGALKVFLGGRAVVAGGG